MPLLRLGDAANSEWPTLGWHIIDDIEATTTHGPGDVQGDPFELDDDEAQFLLDCYRLFPKGHPRAGQRVVTRAVYSRSKGSRKSELAGAVVKSEACGAVRFDRWAGDDPVGRKVTYPFVRCLATEETQTGNTYDNVRVMLESAVEQHGDRAPFDRFARNGIGLTRVFLPGGGEIRPSTASSSAKDGGKETFIVADETHLYVLPELRQMHRTVSRNLRKRKAAEPWLLETTTAPEPGQNSVAEDVLGLAQQVDAGKARMPPGLYVNWRSGGPVKDWADDDQVRASLAEAFEGKPWVPTDTIFTDDIRAVGATEADSRRYWLNQMHKGSASAFDLDRWRSLTDASIVVPDGELITAGFDGSRFDDATALIATTVESGHQFVVGLWEHPLDEAGRPSEDWEVPADEVEAAIEELFDRWEPWRVYCDPPYWDETISRWAGRWPGKVQEWWTNRPKVMAYALKAYTDAMHAPDLTHDGDDRLARHVGNARRNDLARLKDDKGRPLWTIRKEHPMSPNKIDGAMAGCLSWQARLDALTAGAEKTKRRRAVGM